MTSNRVFESEDYLKDRLKFYVLEQNLSSKTLKLVTDGYSYVVCQGLKDYPTWVWTSDNFDKLKELENVLNSFLSDNPKDRFTCKKRLYELLKQDKYPYLNDDYFKLGVLTCEAQTNVELSDAYLDRMQESDVSCVANYWYLDNLEMQQDMPSEQFNLDKEKLYQEVVSWLDSDTFYVLRDNNGQVVSMVMYKLVSDMAKLTHVYTPVEYRCKGYAKTVVYLVTKLLLDKGYKVMLYTDYNNPKSNKAYKNAGFKEEEYLVNFTCSKKKVLK